MHEHGGSDPKYLSHALTSHDRDLPLVRFWQNRRAPTALPGAMANSTNLAAPRRPQNARSAHLVLCFRRELGVFV